MHIKYKLCNKFKVSGHSGDNTFNSADNFNFSTQEWCMVSSLATKIVDFGVWVLNEVLYVVNILYIITNILWFLTLKGAHITIKNVFKLLLNTKSLKSEPLKTIFSILI